MDEFSIGCPYCGEMIDILVDGSEGEHECYEDCSVCCSPILLEVSFDELGELKVFAKRDSD
jgi:hypothetical protein